MRFSLRFLAACSNSMAISFVARGYDAMADAAQEKKKRRRYFYRKRPKDTTPLPKLNMEAVSFITCRWRNSGRGWQRGRRRAW